MTCIKTGARVFLAEYNAIIPADIYSIGDGAVLIRGNKGGIERYFEYLQSHDTYPSSPTHTLTCHPIEGFWRTDLCMFAVPVEQLTEYIQAPTVETWEQRDGN